MATLRFVLTVLSLRTDEPDARFEKLWNPDMMLCGLCAERCDGERLGGLSAAYGCGRCFSDERPGDDGGNDAGPDGGVAGRGNFGGERRLGRTPCRDQRLEVDSNVFCGGCCSLDPSEETDDHDELGRPSSCGVEAGRSVPFGCRLGLRLGLGLNFWLEIVEGEFIEGDVDADSAGDAECGDRKALPLCRTPSVSAVLRLVCVYVNLFRLPFALAEGGAPLAVQALRRGGGCSEAETKGVIPLPWNLVTCPSMLPPFTPMSPRPLLLSRPIDGNRVLRS